MLECHRTAEYGAGTGGSIREARRFRLAASDSGYILRACCKRVPASVAPPIGMERNP